MVQDIYVDVILKAVHDMMDEIELKALIREQLEAAYNDGVEDTLEEE